jgi:alpha-galactosidase
MNTPQSLAISAAGTALCFSLLDDGAPAITHWGAAPTDDLHSFAAELAASEGGGVTHSSVDASRRVPLLPGQAESWAGTAALEVRRGARTVFPRLALETVESRDASGVTFLLQDAANGIRVEVAYDFDAHGVLRAAAELQNLGADPLDLVGLRLLLPLPARADELLDLTGRWSAERRPQRSPLTDGTRRRAARHGRPGHDSPTLSMAGTPGFGFRSGEVWATHLAWSGDGEYLVERLPDGVGVLSALLGAGENLLPGELILERGESYRTPDVVFVWSDEGIDGLSARLHASLRGRAAHPQRPRPLVLNTWEAVYFRHALEPLRELAEVAASIGVERFVLDDGWFLDRRNDTAGLGDWHVDPAVWPDGLEPLAAHVRELGMEFGLWFEPEMVNPGSRLEVEHPDWMLAPVEGYGPEWRHQQVLNLAHPDAWNYLLERVSTLIGELGIAFVKWDHNRDLVEAVDRRTGTAGVHAQTRALYALLDELHRRHPGLEIESCASGGGRVDLGILERTQRVWASDTNDPVARQTIQRWTQVLLPPELVGSHVGPKRAHTTGRETDLSFRLITALFGHAGIEWDITRCSEQELAALTAWAGYYRDHRALLASGTTVRADGLPDGSLLHGVVSIDGAHALYAWVQLDSAAQAGAQRVRLPGLDRSRRYHVEVVEPFGAAVRQGLTPPDWTVGGPVGGGIHGYGGALLTTAGLPLPLLGPAQAVLLEVREV